MKKLLSIFLSLTILLSTAAVLSVPASVSAASKKSKVTKILTKHKWYEYKMYRDGEISSPGSSASQFGAYCKFKKNKKFECNVGLEGCSGKYKVSKKGKVTLYLKKQWDGTGFIKVRKKKAALKFYNSRKKFSFTMRDKYSSIKYYFER